MPVLGDIPMGLICSSICYYYFTNNLKLFLSLLAENYDSIKYYIDNYSNFNSKDYSDVEGIPNNVIELIGDNYGWNFLNPNQLQNLLQYYVGEETANISYKDLTYKIWKNILNNLNYILLLLNISNVQSVFTELLINIIYLK